MYWGKASYSLYMTHYICLITIMNVFPFFELLDSTLLIRISILFFYVGTMMLVAIVTYRFFEEPARRMMVGCKKIPTLVSHPASIPAQVK